jgi:hypothetical protein
MIKATKMMVSQAVTIARNLIQPTDGVPLFDSGMAISMLRARRFFRPVRAHGFAWKITGGQSGVRILDNFQCFIE